MTTPSVLITKLRIRNPPTARPTGGRIVADFEFAAAGIAIRHCKLVVNQHGYIVVWYPSRDDGIQPNSRSVVIDDKDLHRAITTAAQATYVAMGGTSLPSIAPGDLPAFLTTPTPLPAGDHEHG